MHSDDESCQISTSIRGEESAAQHKHDWLDNNSPNPWDQWTAIVQDLSGAVWEATLQIANTTSGEKVLYDIDPTKNGGAQKVRHILQRK